MAEVRLYLFGAPRLVRAEQPVKINTWKALALLAYLAMNGQMHSREALATLFWPEQDEVHARSSLRRALWTLRQVLPSNALSGDKQTIALNSSALVVDVLQYQSLVAATTSAVEH